METTKWLTGDTLLYLYGLVPAAARLSSVAGIDNGRDVFLVAHDDVACAVSRVTATDYQRVEPRNPSDELEWVMPRAWRHHEVLSRLHAAGTVVPLKFGTVCATVDDVRSMLMRLRTAISDLLIRFVGKDEWTLTVSLERDALVQSLKADVPELRRAADETARAAGGREYLLQRKLQQALDREAAEKTEALQDTLFAQMFAAGLVSASIRPVDGKPAAGTMLVVNAALLVDRDRFGDLEMRLAQFETDYAAYGLRAHLTGPWPPYSFATSVGPVASELVN